jgi:hypothetical protein
MRKIKTTVLMVTTTLMLFMGLASMMGCDHDEKAPVPVSVSLSAEQPGWTTEDSGFRSDGVARVVAKQKPLFTPDSTELQAVLKGKKRAAEMIEGTELWNETSAFLREAAGSVVADLGGDERFLRDLTFVSTHARLPSVVVSKQWEAPDGTIWVEVLVPPAELVADLLRAGAKMLQEQLKAQRQKKAVLGELETRVNTAVEKMVDRAAAVEAQRDAE